MASELENNKSLLFPAYQKELEARFKEIKSIKTEDYPYFLKGDISGIQDFIFSVKSKRASRTLKGRSFFIHALSEICLHLIEAKLKAGNFYVFYNGGGNFYLLLKEEYKQEIEEIQAAINEDCKDQEFYVTLAVSKIGDLSSEFPAAWSAIQAASNSGKLSQFKNYLAGFEPYARNTITEPLPDTNPNAKDPFEKFARKLIDAKGWNVAQLDEPAELVINEQGAIAFNHQYRFDGNKTFDNIVHKLPVWNNELQKSHAEAIENVKKRNEGNPDWEPPANGNIIEFEYLAEFAHARTGSRKLGVLKMDVDNLGKLFEGIPNGSDAQKLSRALSYFFGDNLKKLLKEKFNFIKACNPGEIPKPDESELYQHNIYVVFSGGDDCFFIGGWDAIMEFAHLVQTHFEVFVKALKQEIKTLTRNLTVSAGIIMVGPKFPVSRFALLADEALDMAKARKGKNAVNLFGHTLSWEAFASARNTANKLARLILQKGERRAMLERLQKESEAFDRITDNIAEKGIIQGRSIWRLLYSVRRTATKENEKELVDITREYTNVLADTLVNGRVTSKLYRIPVAARWAEFLTRVNPSKINKENESKQS